MNNFGSGQAGGISSATSDPSTAHMRVFVGNLNTPNITKPTLQNVFGKYGHIVAISIHRGFAFVQYNNPHAARSAVDGEHGSIIAGQTIDINISSEPKPNQKPSNSSGQSFGSGYDGSGAGSFDGGRGAWGGAMAKRGRGVRGGMASRGAIVGRGMTRGARGRGVGRGRGMLGGPNKVQTGRVEKPYLANKNKFIKKPMLPPLTTRAMPVESPIIGEVKVTNIETAPTSNGTQPVDLPDLKRQLMEVRDKIDSLLKIFPVEMPKVPLEVATTDAPAQLEDGMELEVKKE